jgi:CheY-like chemotaxis protein
MWNLLTNAVKFTPRGGKITLQLLRVNSRIEISIHDTGIGISPEFLPHLFERFRQADSSSTRKYGGLGLGLSIVKKLVEMHGGRVAAYSRGDGEGATFVVSLPVRAVRSPSESAGEQRAIGAKRFASAPEFSLEGIKVLIVDDEQDARELLQSVLTDVAAEVFTADCADAAIALLQTSRPDVIVSDIGMPERDGYQLIRDVRSLDLNHGGRTPAIALTAFARSEDRTRAMLAGYQMHISKPIEPQELVVTIKSLVESARSA